MLVDVEADEDADVDDAAAGLLLETAAGWAAEARFVAVAAALEDVDDERTDVVVVKDVAKAVATQSQVQGLIATQAYPLIHGHAAMFPLQAVAVVV